MTTTNEDLYITEEINTDIELPNLGDGFGAFSSLSGDGKRLVVGAPNYSNPNSEFSGKLDGRVYIYDLKTSTGTWEQSAIIEKPGIFRNRNSSFGSAIAVSWDGNRIVLGVQCNEDGTNQSPIVYEFNSNLGWEQIGEKITDSQIVAERPVVKISEEGDIVLTGYGGAVYLYGFDGNKWTTGPGDVAVEETTPGKGGHITKGSYISFVGGIALSGDGKTIAIGGYAYGYDPPTKSYFLLHHAGRIQVLKVSGDVINGFTVTHFDKFQGSESGNDHLGEKDTISLSRDGSVILYGAYGSNHNTWNGNIFKGYFSVKEYSLDEKRKLDKHSYGAVQYSHLGRGVAISADGNTIMVGSGGSKPEQNDTNGFVQVYKFSEGEGWKKVKDYSNSDDSRGLDPICSMNSDGTIFAYGNGVDPVKTTVESVKHNKLDFIYEKLEFLEKAANFNSFKLNN